MFWEISTAFVLHGVIISLRGPINVPLRDSLLISLAFPNNQISLAISFSGRLPFVPAAIMFLVSVSKKRII
jgi:hypothetical protein